MRELLALATWLQRAAEDTTYNEEINNLYCSPLIFLVIESRRRRWAGHVARMGERRGLYRVLVGKPEGKKPLGRPRRRWEDYINP